MYKEYGENSCRTYDIKFGDKSFKYHLYNDFENFTERLFDLDDIDSFVILSDENIGRIYGRSIVNRIRKNYRCELIIFDCTEKSKNLTVLQELIEKVISLKATRRTCIIGLGGGICGNMAGMVAALLFRGIKFIHIPTSLMAISDSVLSLKQAINSEYGKNLIGVFHTPEMVITSTQFLKSLPKKEIISGLCETIKNALTILPESIEPLTGMLNDDCRYTWDNYRYFIEMSIKAKTQVMKNDAFEKKGALILEYGHTIGHAIELADAGAITHGEAIGLGMLCAAEISHMLGHLSEKDVKIHRTLLEKAGAPTVIAENINPDTIVSILKYDNKRGYTPVEEGTVYMVLLDTIGKTFNDSLLTAVPMELVRQAINRMYRE
ncbi:2-deoxy-scyllo-inosose synthase [Ruminiclostridium papyrosolvens]|uniref:3-dehydroquinate synthase n=1 Tax=Ruminiclostridium papyrosolvens C7 TaxID=1330534 RepID=U4R1Y5_9FIRM|nr:2-deoxy-scyllo-inosose synthase [Ruminiclostridium papyrosolvens]EPR12198.1 3-dehydroquinate synthase [Ruminiclostridium papyrosolvens C7]